MSYYNIDAEIARDNARTAQQMHSRTSYTARKRRPSAADRQLRERLALPHFDNRVVEVQLFRLEDQDPSWPQTYADDLGERVLGLWLENLQVLAERGELDEAQVTLLDEKLPGWREATLDYDRDQVAARRALHRAGAVARDSALIR